MTTKTKNLKELSEDELKWLLEQNGIPDVDEQASIDELQQLVKQTLPTVTSLTKFTITFSGKKQNKQLVSVQQEDHTTTTQTYPSQLDHVLQLLRELKNDNKEIHKKIGKLENNVQQTPSARSTVYDIQPSVSQITDQSQQVQFQTYGLQHITGNGPSNLNNQSLPLQSPARQDFQNQNFSPGPGNLYSPNPNVNVHTTFQQQTMPLNAIVSKMEVYTHKEPYKLGKWLDQFEAKTCMCTDQQRFDILLQCMQGKAAQIITKLMRYKLVGPGMPYTQLRATLLSQCIPSGDINFAMREFLKLEQRQNETVEEYQEHLEELATLAFHDQPIEYIESQITIKLKTHTLPHIREHLALTKPQTLSACLHDGREKENISQHMETQRKQKNFKEHKPETVFAAGKQKPYIPYKKQSSLNNTEQTQKRCHTCDRPGHFARDCTSWRHCDHCNRDGHNIDNCWYKTEGKTSVSQQSNNPAHNRFNRQTKTYGNKKESYNRRSGTDKHKQRPYAAAVSEGDRNRQKEMSLDNDSTDDDGSEHGTEACSYMAATDSYKKVFLPRIEVDGHIDDIPTKLMIDSGASYSLMSYKFFKRNFAKTTKVQTTTKTLRSLSNNTLKSAGKTALELRLGDRIFYPVFQLIEDMPVHVILGNSFLTTEKVDVINSEHCLRMLNSKDIPMRLSSPEDKSTFTAFICGSSIPSQTRASVYAEIAGVPDGQPILLENKCYTCSAKTCFYNQMDHLASFDPATITHPHMETSIVEPYQGRFRYEVINPKQIPLVIKPNTPLRVEILDNDQIQEFTLKDLTREQEKQHATSTTLVANVTDELVSQQKVKQTETKPVIFPDLIKALKIKDTTKNFTVTQRNRLAHCLYEKLALFTYDDTNLGKTDATQHRIKIGDSPPIALPSRRLPVNQRAFVEQYINDLIKKKIIVESDSPFASPIVLVPKKDGTIRFCVDFRALNKVTTPDQYPLPHPDDLFDSVGKGMVFSKLDCCAGYWQVLVAEEDQPKTAFRTLYGHWHFIRMPFGLRNAPATFQRLMENILRKYLFRCAVVLIDDVLIYSESIDEHVDVDLPNVMQSMLDSGMKIKVKKCEFGLSSIEFLGHMISNGQIRPLAGKVKAIAQMPQPSTVHDVRSFLGMVNYYRRFIPNMARIAGPLQEFLHKGQKFDMNQVRMDSFNSLKQSLACEPVMSAPDISKPFILSTDASYKGLGAILSQKHEHGEKVVAYASHTLSDAQKRYGITELEGYAVIWAVKHFRPYLHNTKFTVVTDHEALRWIMSCKHNNPRLSRWSLELQSYDYDVVYRKGSLNTADYLSRHATCATAMPIYASSKVQLKREQRKDPRLSQIFDYLEKGKLPDDKTLKAHLTIQGDNYFIDDGVLMHLFYQYNTQRRKCVKPQLVVPDCLKHTILTAYHDDSLGGHLGFQKTYNKIRDKYYWSNMYSEITKYIAYCLPCQQRKNPTTPLRSTMQPLEAASYPFQRMAMDTFGPLKVTERRNKYLTVFTDYATRFVEIVPVKDISAETTAKHFVDKIICRYSAPTELLSDRGTQFLNEVIANTCKELKIRKTFTTSYHPCTNGLTERFNKTMAQMLTSYVSANQKDWDLYVQPIAMAYNCSIQDSTLETPFYLMYGRDPIFPIDITMTNNKNHIQTTSQMVQSLREAWQLAKSNTEHAQQCQKRLYDRRAKDKKYLIGDRVFILSKEIPKGQTKKFNRPWKGPYRIIKQTGPNTYLVEHLNGSTPTFHNNINVCRLKPYFGNPHFDQNKREM